MARSERTVRHSLARTAVAAMVAAVLTVVVAGCGGADDGEAGSVPPPPDADAPFDPEASRDLAERWLGVAEEDIEETEMLRIARRGEEFFPATLDLRPGRFNLELDEDDDGVYRVTRILIESDEGDLVVED